MKREALICTIIKNIPPDADIKTYAIQSENPRTPEGCAAMSFGVECEANDCYNFAAQCIRKLAKAMAETEAEVLMNVAYGLKMAENGEENENAQEGDDGQDED